MKKKNLKNLKLNKKSISNMKTSSPFGGRGSNNRQCYSEERPTVCYWVAGCESARRTLCC
ncbi:hypothetical protein [Kordia jejudonensis]|uniref:hypothetical protein n=1 Tax=Kordia jejudonensis TaxID=1348245 RepID=UPI0012E030A8|nr:hypothetical protein [Kordia jejudonensis]